MKRYYALVAVLAFLLGVGAYRLFRHRPKGTIQIAASPGDSVGIQRIGDTLTVLFCPAGGDCGPNGKDWVTLRTEPPTAYWNESTFNDEGTVYVPTTKDPRNIVIRNNMAYGDAAIDWPALEGAIRKEEPHKREEKLR